MRAFFTLVIGLRLALLPAGVLAEPTDASRAAARDLGTQGVEAFQAGRYDEAVAKLDRAFKVVRAPSVGLWSARALAKNNKWVEATERYLEVTRLDPKSGDVAVQKQAQQDAEKEGQELTARLPAFRIEVRGAVEDAQVTIDGVALPSALVGARVPVNPGEHVLVARQGSKVVERKAMAFEAQVADVVLDVSDVPSPTAADGPAALSLSQPGSELADTAPSAGSQRTLRLVGLVVGGAGAVSLGVAGYFALNASSLNRESKASGCDANNVCEPEGYAKRDDAIGASQVATVAAVAGGALLVAGVTLFLVGSRKTKAADSARIQARPALAPGQAGLLLHGRF